MNILHEDCNHENLCEMEFCLLYKAVREVEVFCPHKEIQTSDPRFNECQVQDLKLSYWYHESIF